MKTQRKNFRDKVGVKDMAGLVHQLFRPGLLSKTRVVLAFFFWMIASLLVAQNTWYVKEGGTGSGTGTSWANATGTLQGAINAAAVGDEIWVAGGTYYPTQQYVGMTNRDKTFLLTKSVKIYGGFNGSETILSQRDWRLNKTILDGGINSTDSVFHVLYLDGTAGNISDLVIDGFNIQNGRATGPFGFRKGGGVLVNCNSGVCNFIIRNCTLYNNLASIGGGISVEVSGTGSDASPLIQSCSFIENEATTGAGISFEVNNSGKSSPNLFNNFYHANVAGQGGAIAYRAMNGGESRPKIFGSTFINNQAASGGALLILNTDNPNLDFDLQSSILWNNGDEIESPDINIILFYTLIDDGNPDGSINMSGVSNFGFNLDADPLFVDLSNGNARLKPGSPAIDAGWTAGLPVEITQDFLGKPRVNHASLDMGAIENHCPNAGDPVFVDQDATGTKTGTTWPNALNDLQEGIDQACACDTGTTLSVWVAEGLYLPTEKYNGENEESKAFYINKDVKLYGGFQGAETTLDERNLKNHTTILSGDLGTPGDYSDNAKILLYLDGRANGLISGDFLLDGFEIAQTGRTDGQADGILIHANISPITQIKMANCTIRNHANTGAESNAAINNGGADLKIWNCLLYDNTGGQGAALQNLGNLEIINTTFYNNTSSNGTIFIFDPTTSKSCHMRNSIFWNTDTIVHLNNRTTGLTNCNYDDGTPDGSIDFSGDLFDDGNNIEMDPLFVDEGQRNFRLLKGSPSVNTADILFIGPLSTKDLDGNSRNARGVDMGPYENPFLEPCLPVMVIDNTYGPIEGIYQSDNKLILGEGAVIESGANTLIIAPQIDVENNVNIQLGATVQMIASVCGA